jgi:hypothetical protein
MHGGQRRWWCIVTYALGLAGAFVGIGSRPVAAQEGPDRWNDARARALVALAIARRSRQLADTGLTDYKASAHGYLTFLGQVGPGFPDPPKIVRSDELAVEVYWRTPNLSKQRIIGQRDTLLLPGDIGYYSDRYGIIQNNFPDSIRLGDGHDVHDVPHPLAPHGPDDYDYLVTDSLRITIPDRVVEVYAIRVRPRDAGAPRVVGTVYVERDSGALVRMAVTFTRAAILDHRIETLAVTLDNALVDRRYWLPRHQELDVVRSATWFDYPVRGIIRARWQICCYEINRGLDPRGFAGPEIASLPPAALAAYPWHGHILDSLPPDVAVATVDDVRRVEDAARAIVERGALARVQTAALSGGGISEFVHINRVEGLALGAGATLSPGAAWSVSGRGRYGLDDRQAKGEAAIGWRSAAGPSLRAFAFRSYRDAGDVAEGSQLANSLAAQEFGADHTDPYDVRGVGVGVDAGERFGLRWALGVTRETQRGLAVHAAPANGSYGATIPALALQGTRVTLSIDRSPSAGPWGIDWRAHAELRGESYTAADTVLSRGAAAVGRAFVSAEADRVWGVDRAVARVSLGGVSATSPQPAQEYVYAGGDVSGPGYAYHAFAGRAVGSARFEWQFPVPAPALSLGRFGRTPARAILAPFLSVDYVDGAAPFRPLAAGWYPAAGLGGIALFDLVRIDVARGLRTNGRWTLWIDITRDLWGVL